MKDIEETGRTVDEAVAAALARLKVSADEVDIEVLEEANRGFMGLFGGSPARVRVIVKGNPFEKAKTFIQQVVDCLEIEAEVIAVKDDDGIELQVEGQNVGMLIGRRGQALNAWQYLTNLVANQGLRDRERIRLDIAGYRARRVAMLENLALRTGDRVRERGRPIRLESMTAADRRIIHITLQNDDDLETSSEGREPYRKVVVRLKQEPEAEY
jgi:spoIIIJ-associated protein